MARKLDVLDWDKFLFFVGDKNNAQQSLSKTNDSTNEISIIGVSKVLDSSTSCSRKFLWILSLLVCCSVVSYYVSMRIAYILSMPTQVAVTLQQNESLQLPDVTICVTPIFVPTNLENFGMASNGLMNEDFKLSEPFNVTHLWLQLAPSSDFIAVTMVNMGTSRHNWQLRFSTQGVCYTHKYDGFIQASGLSFGMQIQFDWKLLNINMSSSPWSNKVALQLYLHAPHDEALTELEGIPIGIGEDVGVAIRIKEFQSLSRKEHPCEKKRNYSKSKCVNQCFNCALFQSIKCKFPFMTVHSQKNVSCGQDDIDDDDWCDTRIKYNEAFSKFWNFTKSNLTLWADCGQLCLIECQKFVYTPYIESVAMSRNDIGKLTIYFPEMWYVDSDFYSSQSLIDKAFGHSKVYASVKEKEAYDLIALLCDIGGTFGLFLGCSILTLVELVELTVLKIHRLCQKK